MSNLSFKLIEELSSHILNILLNMESDNNFLELDKATLADKNNIEVSEMAILEKTKCLLFENNKTYCCDQIFNIYMDNKKKWNKAKKKIRKEVLHRLIIHGCLESDVLIKIQTLIQGRKAWERYGKKDPSYRDIYEIIEYYGVHSEEIDDVVWKYNNLIKDFDLTKGFIRGKIGEFLCLEYEKDRLGISEEIEWTSEMHPKKEYDIKSFIDASKTENLYIESKATIGNRLIIPRSEWNYLIQNSQKKYFIYLWDISDIKQPSLYINRQPKEFDSLGLVLKDSENIKWAELRYELKFEDDYMKLNSIKTSFRKIKISDKFKKRVVKILEKPDVKISLNIS
jgi:hypothetical protein